MRCGGEREKEKGKEKEEEKEKEKGKEREREKEKEKGRVSTRSSRITRQMIALATGACTHAVRRAHHTP